MANNSFNFDKYNKLIKDANLGLKLHLGVQLIKDVVSSLEYFDNPLEAELRPVYIDLKDFHQRYKDEAKKRAAEQANPSERNRKIDDSTVNQPSVAEMMQMFQQFQQMMANSKPPVSGEELNEARTGTEG